MTTTTSVSVLYIIYSLPALVNKRYQYYYTGGAKQTNLLGIRPWCPQVINQNADHDVRVSATINENLSIYLSILCLLLLLLLLKLQ